MAVLIDIPGIGQVEAFNAASEQTLQQIAALLGGTSSAFTQASLNRLGSAAQNATTSENRNTRAKERNTEILNDESSSFARLGNAYRRAEQDANQRSFRVTERLSSMTRSIQSGPFSFLETAFSKIQNVLGTFGQGIMGATQALGPLGKAFGFVGGGLVKMIGVLGGVLGLLAGSLKEINQNFVAVANSGAILGGSIMAFRDAAHFAGLQMTDYAAVVQKASNSLAVFGGGTLEGAREFARANRILVDQYGTDLLRAGLNFQDMGVATADFLANLKESGEGFNQVAISSDSIAEGTAKLAMQQKQLAVFNGTTLEQEREKQRAARKDAQLNMVLMGMDAKQRVAVQQLTQTFPQFRQFILESIAFGGPIRKETLMQQQIMGTTTGILTDTLKKVQDGSLSGSAAVEQINELRKNNPRIRAELENQAQLGILGIAGSTNSLVQTAANNFQTQFEIVTKSLADVARLIQQDVEVFERIRDNLDPLTDAIVNITKDTNTARINFSRALTNLFGTAAGSVALNLVQLPTQVLNLISRGLLAISGGDRSGDTLTDLLGFANQANNPGQITLPPNATTPNISTARPTVTTDPQGNVTTLTPPTASLNPNDPDYLQKLVEAFNTGQQQSQEAKQKQMEEKRKQEKEQDFNNLTTMVNNATTGLGNKVVASLEDVKKAVQHG